MRILVVCAALFGCGGDDVDGDFLIETSLAGVYDGKTWEPVVGFGVQSSGSYALTVGEDVLACDALEEQISGYTGIVVVPRPEVGVFTSAPFRIYARNGIDFAQSTGTATITAITATEVTATFAFDTMIEGGRYALNGDVVMVRCN